MTPEEQEFILNNPHPREAIPDLDDDVLAIEIAVLKSRELTPERQLYLDALLRELSVRNVMES